MTPGLSCCVRGRLPNSNMRGLGPGFALGGTAGAARGVTVVTQRKPTAGLQQADALSMLKPCNEQCSTLQKSSRLTVCTWRKQGCDGAVAITGFKLNLVFH